MPSFNRIEHLIIASILEAQQEDFFSLPQFIWVEMVAIIQE